MTKGTQLGAFVTMFLRILEILPDDAALGIGDKVHYQVALLALRYLILNLPYCVGDIEPRHIEHPVYILNVVDRLGAETTTV